MTEHSKIEWTDATWNPVTGCAKVSPGCAHCYAERITNRFGGPGAFDKVVLHPERLELPLHWKKPRMIFVNSMSDLFHEDVPDEFIDAVFALMAICQQHSFQILTKRPARMLDYLTKQAFKSGPTVRCLELSLENGKVIDSNDREYQWPLPNVILMISAENQHTADQRIPRLLQTPAAVRGVSLEPLLAPVNLTDVQGKDVLREWITPTNIKIPRGIDWVIVGGESGPEARPMHPTWARALREQCVEAGVPFFFKQWGEWCPSSQEHLAEIFSGTDAIYDDTDTPRRVGKKKAGRLLDGREWNQMPVHTNPFSSEARNK